MRLLLDVSLTNEQTSKNCLGCKNDSKLYRKVTLKVSFLQVMVKKKAEEKKQQKETEKQQHVIMTENILFKGFITKGVRNYDRKQSR